MQPKIGHGKHFLCSLEDTDGLFFCGKRLQCIVNLEFTLNKPSHITAEVFFFFSGCSPQTTYCNSRGRAVPKDVNTHPVFYNVAVKVVVSIPQESKKVSVVLFHQEAMKHVLDISSDGNGILSESYEDSDEIVVQVRAFE